MSGPDILFFHVFTEGRCKARLAGGGDTVDLRAGDLLLLPRDDQHLLGSDLLLPPTPADRLVQPAGDRGYLRIEHGGGGEKTRFVCGYLRFDERLCAPILRTLPRILCVHLGEAQIPVWISNLLQIGMRETAASQPGGGTLLVKLSELLFVAAMRRYIEQLPEGETGWLAGLRDRYVSRALALLHGRPDHAWTVDTLAEEVALSRSALARRFTDIIGQGPMQYLTRWRLTIAAQRLRSEHASISRIASDSGYESDAAFNRAFKRAFGTTPAAWRRDAKSGNT
jgi:AraC-like DNA-binding protein